MVSCCALAHTTYALCCAAAQGGPLEGRAVYLHGYGRLDEGPVEGEVYGMVSAAIPGQVIALQPGEASLLPAASNGADREARAACGAV